MKKVTKSFYIDTSSDQLGKSKKMCANTVKKLPKEGSKLSLKKSVSSSHLSAAATAESGNKFLGFEIFILQNSLAHCYYCFDIENKTLRKQRKHTHTQTGHTAADKCSNTKLKWEPRELRERKT